MDAVDLTEQQLNAFSIVERVSSVLSLLGCIVIIGTFCASKSFHKPINRLVFYASFGNLMTNVATLIARKYIDQARSPGCQFQAFLIQMFMPADAFWTLAMAVNVYLTFYYKFDAQNLRRMEIPYLICCYGVPFVVALTYVFISNPRQGHMFGNATLWCWVSPQWDIWRIATFYGPVWVVILVTTFIYVRAGREIYKKHKQLREFNYSSHHEPEPLPPMDDVFSSRKTTEVLVTTEIINIHQQPAIDLAPLGRRNSGRVPNRAVIVPPPSVSASKARPPVSNAAYSVTISSNSGAADSHEPYNDGDVQRPTHGETGANAHSSSMPLQHTEPSAPSATAERTSTTSASLGPASPGASAASPRNHPVIYGLRRRAAYEANSAAWSYTKCAILFFTAMLVTWIPSSANRVFSVVHVDKVSLPLEYMSAFVLPLQGFWNAIIYVVTSWKACRTLWDDAVGSRPLRKSHSSSRRHQQHNSHHHGSAATAAGHYQRQSSFGGAPGTPGTPAGSFAGRRASELQSKAIMLETVNERAGQNGFGRVRSAGGSSISNGSDEMLDRMVGGRSAAPKSEKSYSYESESVTELAASRPSRDN